MKIFFFVLFILSGSAFAESIVFIVNEGNPNTKITDTELTDIYLKKTRKWTDGTDIRFLDREDNSAEKKTFLKDFIHRTQREIDQFWIGQKLYTGNAAPTQLGSATMTISLVARFPGAIGYLKASDFKEQKGIRKIEITGAP